MLLHEKKITYFTLFVLTKLYGTKMPYLLKILLVNLDE